MNDQPFLLSLGAAAVLALAVVVYLRPHLRRILADLCGTQERADFWTAFANVTLVLTPLLCTLFQWPGAEPEDSFVLLLSRQLRLTLIGLLGGVTMLGFFVSLFIVGGGAAAPGRASGALGIPAEKR